MQRNHPETAHYDVTEPSGLVDSDLLGAHFTNITRGVNYAGKFTDHVTRFESWYFVPLSDHAINVLVQYVREVAFLNSFRVHHLRSEEDGEHIAGFYRSTASTRAPFKSSLRQTQHDNMGVREIRTDYHGNDKVPLEGDDTA